MCTSRITGYFSVVAPVIVLGDRWQPVKWQAATVKKHQSSGRCRVAVVMSKLDIFAKSQASVCIDKKSVIKKEVASLHLAERLANMAAEQELWTSYPLSALEARVHALSTQTALRHTLSRRPNARCVFANCPRAPEHTTLQAQTSLIACTIGVVRHNQFRYGSTPVPRPAHGRLGEHGTVAALRFVNQ